MIYARYIYPNSGYPQDRQEVSELLEVGNRYLVESVDMGQSYTTIFLDGFKRGFNSIYFEFEEEDGSPVNIYKDRRFNHYM